MLNTPEKKSIRVVASGLMLALGFLSVHPLVAEGNSLVENAMAKETPVPENDPARSPRPPPATPEAKKQKQKEERINLGGFLSTCYALRGPTASGRSAGYGKIAVDPEVIALGTHLYIEDYGEAVAADTGPAIQGRKIDIWKPTIAECRQWGRQIVEVSLLQK